MGSAKICDNSCPYCRVKLSRLEDKEEHLKIHKILMHKKLPVRFESASLAKSSLPIIVHAFEQWISSREFPHNVIFKKFT